MKNTYTLIIALVLRLWWCDPVFKDCSFAPLTTGTVVGTRFTKEESFFIVREDNGGDIQVINFNKVLHSKWVNIQ